MRPVDQYIVEFSFVKAVFHNKTLTLPGIRTAPNHSCSTTATSKRRIESQVPQYLLIVQDTVHLASDIDRLAQRLREVEQAFPKIVAPLGTARHTFSDSESF